MPWRNFISKDLKSYTTTDMSERTKAQLEAQGWHESNLIAFQIVTFLQGRDPRGVLDTLKGLIEWSESDADEPRLITKETENI
jgi:hypothetical protein